MTHARTVPADQGPLGGRYTLEEALGSGGFGTVYRARDSQRGERVALKMLHYTNPEEIRMLKREFRVARDIVHPNLVGLRELVADGDSCFFTMDEVIGQTLSRYVEARSRLPQDALGIELVRIFADVASGLAALHERDVLHLDLKPGNVIVTPTGHAIILDFGLASHAASAMSRQAMAGTFSGSPGYASPEQCRGAGVGPASDMFGVGVMLFEVLTGVKPFDPMTILNAHLDPSALVAQLPATEVGGEGWRPTLLALTRRLLSFDPAARPTAKEVERELRCALEALDAARATGPHDGLRDPGGRIFVGRDTELAALAHWATGENAGRLAVVEGPAGIGKSALVAAFQGEREAAAVAAFKSVCHMRERVPFNAFDQLVDELVRFVGLHGAAAVEPRGRAELVEMFPAFNEVFTLSGAISDVARDAREEVAFDALAELLERIALKRPVLLVIDDYQWADDDSRRLLAHLLRSRSGANVKVLITKRSTEQDSTTPPSPELPAKPGLELVLRALDGEARRALAAALVDSLGLMPERVAMLANGGAGHPLLTRLLATSSASPETSESSPGSAIAGILLAQLRDSTEAQRALLTMLLAASRPIPAAVLQHAWTREESLERVAHELSGRLLAQFERRGEDWAFGIHHNLVRESLAPHIERAEMVSVHRRLALAHAQVASSDPFARVEHELESGERDAALRCAVDAGERAFAVFAFGQASALFRLAMELCDDSAAERATLDERLARSLICDGRAIEGAEVMLAALRRAPTDAHDVTLGTRFRAAEYLLRGGARAEGVAAMRGALEASGVGWHRTEGATLRSFLWNRLRVRLARALRAPGKDAGSQGTPRLDALWSAGVGLSFYEPLRAFDYQARHALLAERVGEPGHLARAHSTEAMLIALRSGPAASEVIARHHGRALAFAQLSGRPEVQAHLRFMETSFSYSQWRFEAVIEHAHSTEEFCRTRCPEAQWERSGVAWLEACALGKLGRLERQGEVVEAALRAASRRGDVYLQTMIDMGPSTLHHFAAGTPRVAIERADEARARGGQSGFLDYLHAFTVARAHLYLDEPAAALEAATLAWGRIRRMRMSGLSVLATELLELLARASLAVVVRGGADRATRRRARSAIKGLKRLDHPGARAQGAFLDALARAHASDLSAEAQRFHAAALMFLGNGQAIESEVARALGDGPEQLGARLQAIMLSHGASSPPALTRLFVTEAGRLGAD